MKNDNGYFLLYVLLFTILWSVPVLLDVLFIHNAGENSGFDEIVSLQKSKDAIYGTASNQNTFLYKLEMVKMVKPVVIALGSSRVMQFREEYFNSSFVNCGGAMNYINEGRMFLEKMLLFHKPKLMLFGVDFWWFNNNIKQPTIFDYHDNDGKVLTIDKLVRPFSFLLKAKITIKDVWNILFNRHKENGVTKYYNIGLNAITDSRGFRKDGSYLYAGIIFGLDKGIIDHKFNDSLNKINKGGFGFEYGDDLAKDRIEDFKNIVNICRDNKIDLIIINPPLSHTIYSKIYSMLNKYSYVDKFREFMKLQLQNMEFYDFQNILDIGSNDCECIDGIHGGDVTYQKILLKIIEDNPKTALKDYLLIDIIKYSVVKYKGKTLSIFKDDKYKLSEVDFLQIGCKK